MRLLSKKPSVENNLRILATTTDLYGDRDADPSASGGALFEVQTFYERMFLKQGYKITYLSFTLDHEGPYLHPSDFDSDYWRSVEGPRQILRNV